MRFHALAMQPLGNITILYNCALFTIRFYSAMDTLECYVSCYTAACKFFK